MRRWLAACALSLLASSAVLAVEAELPNPAGLRPQVEFWKQVFGKYSTYEVLVHDVWRLDRIYSVLDFSSAAELSDPQAISAYIEERTREEKDRIRAMLLRLSSLDGEGELTAEERRLLRLFRDEPGPEALRAAAEPDRLRGQRGLRERFAAGIQRSRRFLPEMEAIFRRKGLPRQLTRLPFVESSFNVRAYSKVGAAGIWQFMPGTGRLYLAVGDQVDERRDPIRSTEAAADFLRGNYEALGDWALAVTAYNHGRNGMRRAVDTVGSTDIVRIVKEYRGPLFKFASRNFYAEFLAAVEVERDSVDYFGDLEGDVPLRTEAVTLPRAVPLAVLASAVDSDAEQLGDLNPSLTPDVVRGTLAVPGGFRLRVPLGRVASIDAVFAAPRAAEVASRSDGRARDERSARRTVRHRVERGQTLAGIARRYRVSEGAIRRQNNLRAGAGLNVGQSLVIPEG